MLSSLHVSTMASFSTINTEDFESIGIPLPDKEETQIWDNPNDTVSLSVRTNLHFKTFPHEYKHSGLKYVDDIFD